MMSKLRASRERDERGFTLIELLVVILIIAILAAIAIPVFLNQRKKGWAAQSQSSLKNAAIAAESLATANNGSYTTLSTTTLAAEGYNATDGVILTVEGTPGTDYCLKADHEQDTPDLFYSSTTGTPGPTC